MKNLATGRPGSLAEGGTPPRFLIIDDGWQQIGSENKEESNSAVVVQEGAQYVTAITVLRFVITMLGVDHAYQLLSS